MLAISLSDSRGFLLAGQQAFGEVETLFDFAEANPKLFALLRLEAKGLEFVRIEARRVDPIQPPLQRPTHEPERRPDGDAGPPDGPGIEALCRRQFQLVARSADVDRANLTREFRGDKVHKLWQWRGAMRSQVAQPCQQPALGQVDGRAAHS